MDGGGQQCDGSLVAGGVAGAGAGGHSRWWMVGGMPTVGSWALPRRVIRADDGGGLVC